MEGEDRPGLRSADEQEAMADDLSFIFSDLGQEATWTWIKRWATVNEDYNALWFDEEYAKNSGGEGSQRPRST